MKKKKILIAGGAGYIGTRLTTDLLKKGYDVTVLDLLWFGNNLPKQAKLIKKNIFEADEEMLKGFDRVIFLAGLSNDPMAEYSPALNFIHNASSPTFLAYMSKKAGVPRFIYASSCSVYGNSADNLNKETSVTKSLYPYGLSKLQGEFATEALADKNFSVICLRQGTVSGFSPRMRFDLIVNTMYMKAMTEGQITVDNPKIWRPILAISDAVNVYIKAIEAKSSVKGIFNVSSGNYTVGQVAKTLRKHFKERHGINLKVQQNNIKNFRNYKVSTEKASRVLGLNFRGSVELILKELDENVGKNFDFTNDKYFNIRVFKNILDSGKIDQI